MKIKLDENLPASLLPILKNHAHDVYTALVLRQIERSQSLTMSCVCPGLYVEPSEVSARTCGDGFAPPPSSTEP